MSNDKIKEALDTLRAAIPSTGDGGWEIYALIHGWVIAGQPVEDKEDFIRLGKAYVVRRWGTTKGLSQLATEGAQENTALDSLDGVKIQKCNILFSLPSQPL